MFEVALAVVIAICHLLAAVTFAAAGGSLARAGRLHTRVRASALFPLFVDFDGAFAAFAASVCKDFISWVSSTHLSRFRHSGELAWRQSLLLVQPNTLMPAIGDRSVF